MFGSGFSWPTTRPVASAVASSETSTGVATAPMPVSIDDHSLIGTPRYFLPCMSFGDSTFSFEVSWRVPWNKLPMMRMLPFSTSSWLISCSGADVRGSVATHGVLGVAIHERRVEHGDDRHDLAERGEVVVAHGDRAGLDAVDHLADAAELGVREHLDLDAAVGALLDQLRDLVGVERLRRVGDADMRVAQPDLGRGVARRAGDADDDRRRNQSRKTSHREPPVDARFAPCRRVVGADLSNMHRHHGSRLREIAQLIRLRGALASPEVHRSEGEPACSADWLGCHKPPHARCELHGLTLEA